MLVLQVVTFVKQEVTQHSVCPQTCISDWHAMCIFCIALTEWLYLQMIVPESILQQVLCFMSKRPAMISKCVLQDNEARFASLTQITSVPLGDILSAIAADATPENETHCSRLVGFCLCWSRAELGIVCCL